VRTGPIERRDRGEPTSLRALATGLKSIAALILVCVGVVPGLYLAALAALSLRPTRPRGTVAESRLPRICVLVPAHNEVRDLPVVLESLREVDYPRDLVAVHVVADNCTDATADVPPRYGAVVHVRSDPRHAGKGAALNWLLARVLRSDPAAQAFVFVDADSHVSRGALRAFASALAGGAKAVQGLDIIQPVSDRPLATLRKLAFHLVCDLRPLAYQALGASAGLHGNGMCFSRSLVETLSWDEAAVVEDGALHLRLVEQGISVAFAREALITATAPEELGPAYGQTVRWERGKFDLFGVSAALIARGVRQRDRSRVIAGMDTLIPPFSVTVAASIAGAAAGLVFAMPSFLAASALTFAGCAAYVARGIALSRIGAGELARAGLFAPRFLGWKLFVIARVAGGAGRGRWTRAERGPAPAPANAAAARSDATDM